MKKSLALDIFTKHIPPGILSFSTLAAILWLTLSPNPSGDVELPLFAGADKLAHGLMFGFLTACLYIDYRKIRHTGTNKVVALCTAIASAIGVSIEYLQKWMDAGRSFEYADMSADVCGTIIVAIIIISLKKAK